MKLNLGCGQNRIEGYLNVDLFGEPDLVFDLETFPWPWADDSVDEILLIHVLEHLGQDKNVFLRIIQEIYRVCRDGAVIRIKVPHPRSDDYLSDPTHVRPINIPLLALFSRSNNLLWKSGGYANSTLALYLDVDLEISDTTLMLKEPWNSRFQRREITEAELNYAEQTYNNVISEIVINMRAKKTA